jgi:hypothetical protein
MKLVSYLPVDGAVDQVSLSNQFLLVACGILIFQNILYLVCVFSDGNQAYS